MIRSFLLWLGTYLVQRFTPPVPPPPPPLPLPPTEIRVAVLRACVDEGLNIDRLSDDSDLVSTGKLYAVLHHAAIGLGKDHELRTVGDVIAWLAEAPPPIPPAEIRIAVLRACADEGLNIDRLSDDSDLVSTGKLYAVLHHAAIRLGKDHELRTVGDVIAWLAEAPDQ